jgi:hypothetical protein
MPPAADPATRPLRLTKLAAGATCPGSAVTVSLASGWSVGAGPVTMRGDLLLARGGVARPLRREPGGPR